MLSEGLIIDQLIANENRSMRDYLIFGIVLISVGVIVVVIALLERWPNSGAITLLSSLFGAVISGSGCFQLKELVNCKGRVGAYQMIKTYWNELGEGANSVRPSERKRIEDTLWKIIESKATG